MNSSFVLRHVTYINGETVDIIIKNKKIVRIAKAGEGQSQHVFDCSGMYVSSGWIDLHAHAFPAFDPYGDHIDEIGVKQGVTTIVDAGSCGADRFSDLITSDNQTKTNLFAFLNISRIGLKQVDELSNLAWIDRQKILHAITVYPEKVIGLKARISRSVVGKNKIKPLQIARELADETKLPLMVHIGSGPPAITEIVSLLKNRDIITHFLNGKMNGLFDANEQPYKAFLDAIDRGVRLDVGHGTASFSFQTAEIAKKNDIHFDTISTDIYRGNRLNGPVYSMAHTLSKFLYLGYSLEDVISAVTVNAANWLNKPELGRIQVGDLANLTLFTLENKQITLTDSEGDQRIANKYILAKGVVINGELITY